MMIVGQQDWVEVCHLVGSFDTVVDQLFRFELGSVLMSASSPVNPNLL